MVSTSGISAEYRTAQRRRILIYSQYRVLLDGLQSALGKSFDVDTVHNWDCFLRTLNAPDTDAAVIGLDVLGEDRSRNLLEALAVHPELPVVLLSTNGQSLDPSFATQARARALCHARQPLSYLTSCVERALEGESRPLHFEAAGDPTNAPPRTGPLTARQIEVLRQIATGSGAKEIANALGISVRTAEFHRAAIMDRLDLRSTAQLTRYALQNGIC